MTQGPDTYHFARPARTRRNAVIVIGVLFCLGLARVVLDAAWGILAVGALFVLPAIWDMVMDRVATMTVDDRSVQWKTAGQAGTVPLNDIVKVVLDTRLDQSIRMTLHLTDGARLRVPSDCVLPQPQFVQETRNSYWQLATHRH